MEVMSIGLTSVSDGQPHLSDTDSSEQTTTACCEGPGSDSICSTDDFDERLVRTNIRSLRNLNQESSVTPWGRVVVKIALTLLGFLLLMFLIEHFCENFVADMSEAIMSWMGLPGLFLAVFLADGVPQPFTYVPLIFVAVKGAVSKPVVFLICTTGSYSAALVGYAVGKNLRSLSCGDALFSKFTQKYPHVPDLMQRRGAVGVALAAFLPVPLAVTTWTAGSFGVHFPHFLLAGLCRAPKIALFVLLSHGPQQQPHTGAQDGATSAHGQMIIVVES